MKRNREKQDRHFSIEALRIEWKLSKDKKSAGIDNISPVEFGSDLDTNLYRIYKSIYSDSFGFRELKVIPIPKGNGKKRIICIPTVGDRLVQRVAVRLLTKDKSTNKLYLNKQLELENNPIVYGLGSLVRPNSGVEDALKKAVEIRQNFPWVLKTDIQSFFDKIDRKTLVNEFNSRFSNVPTLVRVVEKAINCESEKSKTKLLAENGIKRGVGIRQGMPLSPILSSFFLRKFDKEIRKKIGKEKIIRYADDIIAFASSEKECKEMKDIIETELNKIKLSIPSLSDDKSKTKIVHPDNSVTFLGMEIYKASDGRYGKNIDPQKCQEIEDDFRKDLSFEYAVRNNISLSKLLQRFDSKKRGYNDVYKGADNLGRFMKELEVIKYEAQKKMMQDVFGQDLFDTLSPQKKKFLGFEEEIKKTEKVSKKYHPPERLKNR